MATRRPRVPKSAHRQSVQRSLVATGASAGRGTYVTGHSAKVIPLDAAPSLHVGEAAVGSSGPAGSSAPSAPSASAGHRDPGTPAAVRAGGTPVPGGAVGAQDSAYLPGTSADAAAERAARADTERNGGPSGAVRRQAPATTSPTGATHAPGPVTPPTSDRGQTAAERRAAARRDLLRRATPGGSPAARRQRSVPSAPGPTLVEPVPARNFSGRSVALLVVLFVAAVLLAPTLRVFLDQQAELRAVQDDIAAQHEEQRELTAEIARWDDPAYIRQQARDRFNLVMPGEKAYMVIGGDEAIEDPVPPPASPSEVNPDMPWADALWDSVVRAGTD